MTEPSVNLARMTAEQLAALDAMTGGKAQTFRVSDEPTPTTRPDPIVARAIERMHSALDELEMVRSLIDHELSPEAYRSLMHAVGKCEAAGNELCVAASTAVKP